jgi:hypothetical protein
VSVIGGEHWLVMLDESGFLESAFVIDGLSAILCDHNSRNQAYWKSLQ